MIEVSDVTSPVTSIDPFGQAKRIVAEIPPDLKPSPLTVHLVLPANTWTEQYIQFLR